MSDNLAHALSGAGGGIISMILTYPLITVSSRLQVQKDSQNAKAYKGARDAILKIFLNEGIPGLYAGLSSAIFGMGLTNGVYYYFYELTKSFFEKMVPSERYISTIEYIIASALAGSATVIITNPIWVVNTRMTTRKQSLDDNDDDDDKSNFSSGETSEHIRRPQKAPSTLDTILKIIKQDGVRAFWAGVMPALILVANPIIQYTLFEQLKSRLRKTRKLGKLDFFMLGAISKIAATGSTYPYIVVKSRMQLRQSSDPNARYNSTIDGLRKIIRNEGIGGLYKGINSKLLQSVMTSAFLFMSKEALYQYIVILLGLILSRNRV